MRHRVRLLFVLMLTMALLPVLPALPASADLQSQGIIGPDSKILYHPDPQTVYMRSSHTGFHTVRVMDLSGNDLRYITQWMCCDSTWDQTPTPRLTEGFYRFQLRKCDNPDESCTTDSSPVGSTITFEVRANTPPTATAISPASGTTWTASDDQAFVYSATDAEDSEFSASIEIERQDGTDWVVAETIASGLRAVGTQHTSHPSARLGRGVYRWRLVNVCDTSGSGDCTETPHQQFTVLGSVPNVPELLTPSAGGAMTEGDVQVFQIRAQDEDADAYSGRIRVRDAATKQALSFATSDSFVTRPAPSGDVSDGVPPTPIPNGDWEWSATAVDGDGEGDASPWQQFSVSEAPPPPENRAPHAPEITAPADNAVFEPGQRQDFTIRAVDPDGDPYSGRITFTRAMDSQAMEQVADTHLAPSGTHSNGTLALDQNGQLEPGLYNAHAVATDVEWLTSSETVSTFGVASASANPCEGATPLVDGWFGDRYMRLSSATADDTAYLCVRTSQGAASLAGWLRAEAGGPTGGGTPTVGTADSCTDGGDDNLPFPLLDIGQGGTPSEPTNHLWAAMQRADTSVTACFKVKANGGTVLDQAVTIHAPDGAQLTELDFIPEGTGWTAPAPVAPPVGLPSSECYEAPSGQSRIVNASVVGEHVWLYHQADDAVSRVCARMEGSADEGVVVRAGLDEGSTPYTLTTGRPKDDPEVPCRTDDYLLHSEAPVISRLHTTDAMADPVGVCLFLAPASSPTNFLSAWLLVDRSPEGQPVTYDRDGS